MPPHQGRDKVLGVKSQKCFFALLKSFKGNDTRAPAEPEKVNMLLKSNPSFGG